MKNIRGVLSSFCFYLDDSDIRNDLSARSIKIPKGAKKSHKQILSSVGIYQVFTCDNTFLRGEEVYDDLINAYRLGIACGLRPGEIMGLQWGDITDDTIHIQRAINEKVDKPVERTNLLTDFCPKPNTLAPFSLRKRLS